MNISIVLPNYNGEKLLQENLPRVLGAVKDYKKGKVEIVISDDASTDDSVHITKKFIASLKNSEVQGKLIANTNRKDGGFSKNVNRGVRVASGEIIILLNTDVVPYKGFLDPLLKHFANSKIFAVGCMDESIEDGKIVLRGRGIGKWKKGFLLHSAGSMDKENTLWVSGGSGAFRKSMWDHMGGLNELYNPFYWEDIDLSYRAQKMGFVTLFEKESRVVHEHSKGTIATSYKPYHIQKIVYRNQFIFVWVNITDPNLLLNHLLWLPYHLVNAVKSWDKVFLMGFLDACMRIPAIIRYRQQIRKLFVVSDRQILKQFE